MEQPQQRDADEAARRELQSIISGSPSAICSAFFLGVFLIKYRIEFLLTFPLFSLMFAWYLANRLEAELGRRRLSTCSASAASSPSSPCST